MARNKESGRRFTSMPEFERVLLPGFFARASRLAATGVSEAPRPSGVELARRSLDKARKSLAK